MINQINELFNFSKTKLLGFLIFIAGTKYGFQVNGDTQIMMQSWYLASMLIGGKTVVNNIKALKELKK